MAPTGASFVNCFLEKNRKRKILFETCRICLLPTRQWHVYHIKTIVRVNQNKTVQLNCQILKYCNKFHTYQHGSHIDNPWKSANNWCNYNISTQLQVQQCPSVYQIVHKTRLNNLLNEILLFNYIS